MNKYISPIKDKGGTSRRDFLKFMEGVAVGGILTAAGFVSYPGLIKIFRDMVEDKKDRYRVTIVRSNGKLSAWFEGDSFRIVKYRLHDVQDYNLEMPHESEALMNSENLEEALQNLHYLYNYPLNSNSFASHSSENCVSSGKLEEKIFKNEKVLFQLLNQIPDIPDIENSVIDSVQTLRYTLRNYLPLEPNKVYYFPVYDLEKNLQKK